MKLIKTIFKYIYKHKGYDKYSNDIRFTFYDFATFHTKN